MHSGHTVAMALRNEALERYWLGTATGQSSGRPVTAMAAENDKRHRYWLDSAESAVHGWMGGQ